ncbi:collagen-like protein [Lutimonas halocynthiae]|uniref:collagen-like protein n=1 Tax=Lutimonas halocynthiae TaxID=1446477 RepID=UPI0025B5224A|nr:collagen-like protein [Lutimonas halocynthiae]MDN3643702.1 collagen-like protein [Lutimonas halocynthiae]
MKKIKLISFLILIATSLLFVQCTTDPIPGPAGRDGADGADGEDGMDGASGLAECIACHNAETTENAHTSYLFSGHYNENMDHDVNGDGVNDPLSQYGNRGFGGLSCTSCHTSDGYIAWAEQGSAAGGSHPVYPGTQTITCTTCHSKHSSFDFENEGFDYALRRIDPVMLVADNSYTIDYGKDEMTSHTCATCHQPRSTFEGSLNDEGTYDVGGRFGPHYGAQSTLLEGIQGAELDGYTYRGKDATAAHRAGSSCTNCHMGEPTGDLLDNGLHSKNPTDTSCTVCHANGIPPRDFLKADFQALEDLLVAEGIITIDDEGDVSIVSGKYDLIPAAALWNYKMIYYDHSHGVHNPNYSKDLVQNSIDALNAN